jgi:hypothetical protein
VDLPINLGGPGFSMINSRLLKGDAQARFYVPKSNFCLAKIERAGHIPIEQTNYHMVLGPNSASQLNIKPEFR